MIKAAEFTREEIKRFSRSGIENLLSAEENRLNNRYLTRYDAETIKQQIAEYRKMLDMIA